MNEVIKQPLRYKEARRTTFVNAGNKDGLGRHRGNVLYGLKLKPSDTNVLIGPGALYTPYGTHVYIDAEANEGTGFMTVDISEVELGGFGVFVNPNATDNYPLVIAVYADLDVVNISDPSLPQARAIETEEDVTDRVRFKAKVVDYDREASAPAFDIRAQLPVYMSSAQGDDGVDNKYDCNQSINGDYVREVAEAAMLFNEVLIGYLILGSYDDSGYIPVTTLDDGSGGWATGVTYVPCRNAFEALQDCLGFDFLLGRNTTLNLDPASPDASTALSQELGQWAATGDSFASGPTTMAPKYGSNKDGPGSEAETYDEYRLPSFMRDGENFKEQLARLDYYLRLWMDRTGDQDLVRGLQDGDNTGGAIQPPLTDVLDVYDGSTSATTNKNQLKYSGAGAVVSAATVGTNTFVGADNRVLQTGLAAHDAGLLDDINAIGSTNYGDTSRSALVALDVAIYNILSNLLGVTVTQTKLRGAAAWGSGVFAPDTVVDRPLGTTSAASNSYTFTDMASNPYLSDNPVITTALQTVVTRTNHLTGNNLLRNPRFWNYTDIAAAPYYAADDWTTSVGDTYVRVRPYTPGTPGRTTTLTLDIGDTVSQSVEMPITDVRTFSAVFEGYVSAPIALELIVYDNVTEMGRVSRALPHTGVISTSVCLDLSDIATYSRIVWSLKGTTDATSVVIYNAGLFTGLPPLGLADLDEPDFLPRGAGASVPMTNVLDMGEFGITTMADGSADDDGATLGQVKNWATWPSIGNVDIDGNLINDVADGVTGNYGDGTGDAVNLGQLKGWSVLPAATDVDLDGHNIVGITMPDEPDDDNVVNVGFINDTCLNSAISLSAATATSSTTLATNTVTSADDLAVTVVGPGYFLYELQLAYTSVATGGIKFALETDTAVLTAVPTTGLRVTMQRQGNLGNVDPDDEESYTDYNASRKVLVEEAPAVSPTLMRETQIDKGIQYVKVLRIAGVLKHNVLSHTSQSTITFKWAQAASSATATTVLAGAFVKATKTNRAL